MSRLCLVILFGLCFAGNAGAGTYQLIGAGAQSCGTWSLNRRDPGSVAANLGLSWVLGFLSGIGFEGGANVNPLQGMDDEGVAGWIDNYCQANPIGNLAAAGTAFFAAHPR